LHDEDVSTIATQRPTKNRPTKATALQNIKQKLVKSLKKIRQNKNTPVQSALPRAPNESSWVESGRVNHMMSRVGSNQILTCDELSRIESSQTLLFS
jgi:hypothetical protein